MEEIFYKIDKTFRNLISVRIISAIILFIMSFKFRNNPVIGITMIVCGISLIFLTLRFQRFSKNAKPELLVNFALYRYYNYLLLIESIINIVIFIIIGCTIGYLIS